MQLILTITDLSRGGAGVARDPGGRVIFVPLTAPGDKVRVQITEEDKRYAQAELLEVLEPSPMRRSARCPIFGKCGGCQWQHLPYENQWATKVNGVKHALQRVQIAPPAQGIDELPAKSEWNYRNRVQLRGYKNDLGFFARGSRDLVNAQGCPIARAELNEKWEDIRKKGVDRPQPYKVELEVLPSGQFRDVWNSSHAAMGFRQVNDDQNEVMRQWIQSSLTPGKKLLDLYGGSGNLSLPLAAAMAEIDCVDISSPEKNPPQDTPRNLRFHRSEVLPWLEKRQAPADSVILDPPREGLAEAGPKIVAAIERLGVTELAAVGCDVDSWVRDIGRLVRKGWRVEKMAVIDFFPQTPHVESIAVLRR